MIGSARSLYIGDLDLRKEDDSASWVRRWRPLGELSLHDTADRQRFSPKVPERKTCDALRLAGVLDGPGRPRWSRRMSKVTPIIALLLVGSLLANGYQWLLARGASAAPRVKARTGERPAPPARPAVCPELSRALDDCHPVS